MCIYIYICDYKYKCVYIYTVYTYVCVPMCVYIHTHGFLPVSACAYLCTCVLSYVQILVSSGGCGTMKIWAYLGSNLNILYYIICIYIYLYIGVKSQDEDDDEDDYYYHYYYDSPADRVFPLNVRHRKDQRQWLAQLAVARSIFQLINDSSPRLQQQKNNRSDDFLPAKYKA